jgi:hypothetical protein
VKKTGKRKLYVTPDGSIEVWQRDWKQWWGDAGKYYWRVETEWATYAYSFMEEHGSPTPEYWGREYLGDL